MRGGGEARTGQLWVDFPKGPLTSEIVPIQKKWLRPAETGGRGKERAPGSWKKVFYQEVTKKSLWGKPQPITHPSNKVVTGPKREVRGGTVPAFSRGAGFHFLLKQKPWYPGTTLGGDGHKKKSIGRPTKLKGAQKRKSPVGGKIETGCKGFNFHGRPK